MPGGSAIAVVRYVQCREVAAMKIDGIPGLKGAIEDIARHPEKSDSMKKAIRNIRRPTASYDIAQLVLEMCGLSAKKAPVCK
jgi:hypothetical protein